MKFLRFFILFCSFSSVLNAEAPSFKTQMKTSLDQMAFAMEVYYAPTRWKEEWYGWDLYSELIKAKQKVDETPNLTLRQYHQIVADFLRSTRDYHVGPHFISTETAKLPIRIKTAKNKFYISYINRSVLTQKNFPYNVGDEVVSFDGKPILSAIKSLEGGDAYINNPLTDRSLTASRLTERAGKAGDSIPKGKVKLEIVSASTQKKAQAELTWKVNEEEVKPPFSSLAKGAMKPKKNSFQDNYPRLYNQGKWFCSKAAGGEIGDRVGFIPDLGPKVWEISSNSSFHAYIYTHESGAKIGYLRIPFFGQDAFDLQEFKDIIKRFSSDTSALVLDITNNPGGDVFSLYALLSHLTSKGLELPTQRALITQEDVIESIYLQEDLVFLANLQTSPEDIGYFLDGFEASVATLKEMADGVGAMIDEWNQERFLTDNVHIYGLKTLRPHHKVHYGKPILAVINELDFSCADILPAILKDNGRAKLFGTTTAGAGGCVLQHAFPNRLGISYFTVTGSILKRLNGEYIENKGVTPDIEYEISPEDLRGNYQEMKKAINQAVLTL